MFTKPYYSFIFAIFLLFSCQSTQITKDIIDNHHQSHGPTKIEESDNDNMQFEFLDFEFSFDENESILSDETELYTINYRPQFKFENNNNKFVADLDIYDKDGEILFSKANISPVKVEKNIYVISEIMQTLINIDFIKYHLKVSYNGEIIDYIGDYEDKNAPIISNLEVGPIITKEEQGTVNTYLSINAEIQNTSSLKWVRLIPPSEEYFWDLPIMQDNGIINISAMINDTKHKRYIDNGAYTLQVNFDKSGIKQKIFYIKDMFNNDNGANYGFSVASELESDKNKILFDFNFAEKINKIEIHLFTDIEGKLQQIGISKMINISPEISKKELSKSFIDDFGNKIKIKNNKKYYYQIYLYTQTFNEVSYISISQMRAIIFQGFSLW